MSSSGSSTRGPRPATSGTGRRGTTALWGQGYLNPSEWVDVTADVLSLDVDTGRNGVDDPGDVGTVSLVLFDPVGAYAIAGHDRSALGNLLHVVTEHAASGTARSVFYGRVTEAAAVGSLGTPTTSVKAIDLVGALLSTDDTAPLPAQGVTERLAHLLNWAGVPPELRDLADDVTALLPVDKAGNRLDAARGAAASSVGGSLWASGSGTIVYRFGTFMYPADSAPAFAIGTGPGCICPETLDLAEKGADVVNVYDWTTSDRDAPLNAKASDAGSVSRFGRNASVRTDLLNSDVDQLAGLVEAELARTARAPERVDPCSVPVHDDESAEVVLVAIGDLVAFDYTGSAPWSNLQLVGGYVHSVTPEAWSITLRCYPAMVAYQWDVALWDVAQWSLGAVPMREKVDHA